VATVFAFSSVFSPTLSIAEESKPVMAVIPIMGALHQRDRTATQELMERAQDLLSREQRYSVAFMGSAGSKGNKKDAILPPGCVDTSCVLKVASNLGAKKALILRIVEKGKGKCTTSVEQHDISMAYVEAQAAEESACDMEQLNGAVEHVLFKVFPALKSSPSPSLEDLPQSLAGLEQADWYYLESDKKQGPISVERVRVLYRQKKLTGRTKVWRKGKKKWTPLWDVPEFAVLVTWFTVRDQETVGPLTTDALKRLLRKSILTPSDRVLCSGETEWRPISEVEGLSNEVVETRLRRPLGEEVLNRSTDEAGHGTYLQDPSYHKGKRLRTAGMVLVFVGGILGPALAGFGWNFYDGNKNVGGAKAGMAMGISGSLLTGVAIFAGIPLWARGQSTLNSTWLEYQ